jgi:arginine decarboxylase
LESFDRHFPGFRSETHGVTLDPDTGDYLIECLRPTANDGADARYRAMTPAQRSHTMETRGRP